MEDAHVGGGYRPVADLTARNAIASGVRKAGMKVFVIADGKEYRLVGGIDNANWQEVAAGGTPGTVDPPLTGTAEPRALGSPISLGTNLDASGNAVISGLTAGATYEWIRGDGTELINGTDTYNATRWFVTQGTSITLSGEQNAPISDQLRRVTSYTTANSSNTYVRLDAAGRPVSLWFWNANRWLQINSYPVPDTDLLGGHRVKASEAERDAIPTTHRSVGMTVYVTAVSKEFRLVGGTGNANWQEVVHSPAVSTAAPVVYGAALDLGTNLDASGNRVVSGLTAGARYEWLQGDGTELVNGGSTYTASCWFVAAGTSITLSGEQNAPISDVVRRVTSYTVANPTNTYVRLDLHGRPISLWMWNGNRWLQLTSYPVSDADLLGGHRVVADHTQRDAIPTTSRVAGMTVYVVQQGKEYRLVGGTTNAHWVDTNTETVAKSAYKTGTVAPEGAVTAELPYTFYRQVNGTTGEVVAEFIYLGAEVPGNTGWSQY